MKSLLRKLADATVLRAARYVYEQIEPRYTIRYELQRRAALEAADYIQSNMPRAVIFASRLALWSHAFTKIETAGLFAEFGVFRGASINEIAKQRPQDIVYGFDSFEGLREDWAGHDCTKGAFDLAGELPAVAANVLLVKGWFDRTVPEFLAEHLAPFAFVHCDCDTYEATATVLSLIGSRIQKGTVIVFDEYVGYRGWKLGEFKAWQEFVGDSGIAYEYLGFAESQVSIRVLGRS
jgi:hypothetical protein